MLLSNLECIPKSEIHAILTAAIPYLKKLNNTQLSIFLADASFNTFDIPKQFSDKLYE